MKRRSFLRALGSLPVSYFIPTLKFLPPSTGTPLLKTAKGIINVGSHARVLWPGVYAAWRKHYDDFPKDLL